MRILFITIAFAPNEFSESIVNSKLVLALKEDGYQVDVISRGKMGPTYSSDWNEPWLSLKENTIEIQYKLGSRGYRLVDFLICSFQFMFPLEGVRWIKRAYQKAEELIKKKKYDIIITRSPSDIPHIVGLKLKKKYNIPWIANWNDPSNGIMPEPYKNNPSKIINYISSYYNNKVLLKVDYNTFPSERLRKYFKNFYNFQLDKSEIIPHIGIKIINDSHKITRSSILSICHAGSLSLERDPELLFRSIARLKNETKQATIKLTIIGIADEQIKKLIKKYNLQDDIFFEGSKPYNETLRLMQSFDILCIIEAKMKEGVFLPSKLSDYVYLNRPVLCYSPTNGTLVDLINKFGGGISLDNQSDESIYDGLNRLIKYKKEDILFKELDTSKLGAYLSKEVILYQYKTIFTKIKY